MTFDFNRITGSEDSKQANFSGLCSRLVMRLFPSAKPVDGKGGDQGLDTYVGTFNGKCQAFQHKYFIERVRSAQRRQIETSLEHACLHHTLDQWVLMLPLDLNPTEIRWFDGIRTKYRPLDMEWWGKTKLQDLLGQYPDIARDFQPLPNLTTILVRQEVDLDRLSVSAAADLLRRAIGSSLGALPSDVVSGIMADVTKRSNLLILLWGPGASSGGLYVKRCEIKNALTRLGHVVHFSEDIWTPDVLSQSGLNLSVAEFIQAKAYDYIVCMMSSPGAIGEVHDFARFPRLARKMLICVDHIHEAGYSAQGVLRIFEGNHGRLDWFNSPTDLEECHLATRVLSQISKVAEARQWILATGSS